MRAAALTLFAAFAASAFVASPLAAQGNVHSGMPGMPGMSGMPDAPTAVSAKAHQQIGSVERAMRPLGDESAASAAGFHPVFGWIPTMGVHWIDRALMQKNKQTDRTTPSQLMFSKIGGKGSLVGAAYGYFAAAGDSALPPLFDGAPAWHEHANLAPPGQTLVMLHVWFVPSPDGPFAGTNPTHANDAGRWGRAAERAAGQWDAIYSAYLASARTQSGRARMEQFVSMLLGAHEHNSSLHRSQH